MTLEQFITKYNGKKIDFDGVYGAQCVDLARQYISECLGLKEPAGVSGAKNIYENYKTDPNLFNQFIQIPNTPLTIPKPGDIVIWDGTYGPYGHIAVIIDANLMSFRAFSQNDPANSPCIIKKYSYNKVYGFLRKK